MKKFITLIVLFCVVMIHASVAAEMQPVQLYDQNVFTLTRTLQTVGIKIWNMNHRLSKEGYPGYEANFGDNPVNQMAFLVGNGNAVLASAIITRFTDSDYPAYPTVQQAFEVAGATLVICGLTLEDVAKLDRELTYYWLSVATFNPRATKCNKVFSSYSVRNHRLIVMEISMEEIRPNVGEFRIFMYARA